MIEESGTISHVEGDYAWVSSAVKSGCSSCASNNSCGTSSLSQFFGNKKSALKMRNNIQANVGDSIVFGLEESDLVRIALMNYGLPLLGLIVGMIIGDQLLATWFDGLADFGAFLGSIVGLWLGLAKAKKISNHYLSQGKFCPVILRLNRISLTINPL